MAGVNTAYDYILSTYGNSATGSRFDAHKRSELKSTYNNILLNNKKSPLFKINMEDEDVSKFAVDVKESARNTKLVVADIDENGESIEHLLSKKVAISSDAETVAVKYVGKDADSNSNGFDIDVDELAKPQVNTGRFLSPNSHDFEEGHYSFDLDTANNSFEFQYNVMLGDTNLDVQNKIVRLVNNSDVGLEASIIRNNMSQTAIRLESKQTGLAEGEDALFKVDSQRSFRELNILGIDKVSQTASNSRFRLNGAEHSSMSNTFTINNEFELTLKDTTEFGTVHIGFKANTDALTDSIEELTNAYNNFIAVGEKYSNNHHNSQLVREMRSIFINMGEDLDAIGFKTDGHGFITVDKDKLSEEVLSSDSKATFTTLNNFKSALSKAADKTDIDPLKYVDKLLVEYKNPGKETNAVYASSVYAGMMLDKSL